MNNKNDVRQNSLVKENYFSLPMYWLLIYSCPYILLISCTIIVWQRFCEPCQTKNCILSVRAFVRVLSDISRLQGWNQLAVHLYTTLVDQSCFIAISILVEPSQTDLKYSSLCQTLLTARSVH